MRLDDAEQLFEVYGDPTTMRFLASDLPATPQAARTWVEAKIDQHERLGLSLWAVVDRATGEVIGDAGLQYERGESGDVGIGGRLARRRWGQGAAIEVGHALLTAGFEQLGLDRIVGITRTENVAARRACERLGMRYEGDLPYFGPDDGLWAVYAAEAPR